MKWHSFFRFVTVIVFVVLLVIAFALPALAASWGSQTPAPVPPLLENVTLYQLVAFILSAGGIAILLQKIPAWVAWTSPFKAVLVTVLNLVGGFLLPAVVAQIPTDIGMQTLDKLLIGLFMAVASFIIHTIDTWLAANAAAAKARAPA